MLRRSISAILTVAILLAFSSCDFGGEPPALSGVAPATVDVQPNALANEDSFLYDNKLSFADSFNQMNSLRLSICNDMYAATVMFSDDSAWVPIAANKFALGSSEFLAASFVMEIEPSVTAKKLFRDSGFENVQITPLDHENTWKITATKKEDGTVNNYEYNVMYGADSDSYRFTLTINEKPTMLLASKRITGGYAVEVWTPEGTYRILAQDIKEGRFGFIPKPANEDVAFPETDIYFSDEEVTSAFTTTGAEYTFLLANNILYIAKDGSNYAVPLR